MTISIEPLEVLWIVINLTAVILTVTALLDARADQGAVRQLNGAARELAAAGLVRREWFRLAIQALLLSLVLPGLFVRNEVSLSLFVVDLIAISLLVLGSTVMDSRDRKRMTIIVASDLLAAERVAHLDRLEAKLDLNIAITEQARDHADAAYHEANDVNQKIADQGSRIDILGDALDRDRPSETSA